MLPVECLNTQVAIRHAGVGVIKGYDGSSQRRFYICKFRVAFPLMFLVQIGADCMPLCINYRQIGQKSHIAMHWMDTVLLQTTVWKTIS